MEEANHFSIYQQRKSDAEPVFGTAKTKSSHEVREGSPDFHFLEKNSHPKLEKRFWVAIFTFKV
ncbi:hypothetical protein NRIC_37270 [Enterococcus florum]|uniref:Uncharacterized protein n=1 Tax=Enterococcus florum TaxID=2480627 RepID=A0A4P5PD55_9ENTE|nr:hypothetical protein NRIC_37270 [Enterococcus florum]